MLRRSPTVPASSVTARASTAAITACASTVAIRATRTLMPSSSSTTWTPRVQRAASRRRRAPWASITSTARFTAARVADRVPRRATGRTRCCRRAQADRKSSQSGPVSAQAPSNRRAASTITDTCPVLISPSASASHVSRSGPASSRALSIRACVVAGAHRTAAATSSRAASSILMRRCSSLPGTCSQNSSTRAVSPAAATRASVWTLAHHDVMRSCTCRKVTASSGPSDARSTISRMDRANGPGSMSTTTDSSCAAVAVKGSISVSTPSG
ncbi:MAG: hypothetical protein QG661_573 [Actinomycetota bacterium]|nr:hypothetical protein [Actinomycetota bacterium]